jgi:PKHD-type hydroxylase
LVIWFNKNAGWNFQYEKCEQVQFTEYKPGQHYDWHYDYNSDKNDGTIRKLSIVVSLSDPSEYEGGEFLLSNANVVKPAEELTVSEIKPKGSILVFPSFLWHKVVPVTKGVRYSAVAWMRGKNFI